jgi:hypothetical protein
MVREMPDGTAEVVTLESGRLLRHRVEESGALTELTGAGRTPLYLVGTAMTHAGALAAFGLFALLRSVAGTASSDAFGGPNRGRPADEQRAPRRLTLRSAR